MRRFAITALAIVSISQTGHAQVTQSLTQDVLFDCKMGAIENFESDAQSWISKEELPFALFLEVDPANQSLPVKSVKTVDPSHLMPVSKGGFLVRHHWPASILVKIAPENNPLVTFSPVTAMLTKMATFTTPAMDVQSGRTKAVILMANGSLTDMDRAGQMGTCAIFQGDAARTRFSELSK